MLSGVDRHFPRQIAAPASSTTHIEVCSRDTSSPTYCCCFMVVLRFVTTEALMLQAPAPAITGCPDLPPGRAPRAAAVNRDRGTSRDAAPPTPPGIRVRTTAVRRIKRPLASPWRSGRDDGSELR